LGPRSEELDVNIAGPLCPYDQPQCAWANAAVNHEGGDGAEQEEIVHAVQTMRSHPRYGGHGQRTQIPISKSHFIF
jgi:hypothetical protein